LTAAIVTTLRSGDAGSIGLPLRIEQADGYNWTPFTVDGGAEGFIAFGPGDLIQIKVVAIGDEPSADAPSVHAVVTIDGTSFEGELR
jgi:hypothetical protein